LAIAAILMSSRSCWRTVILTSFKIGYRRLPI
jgi:hypothetical protein